MSEEKNYTQEMKDLINTESPVLLEKTKIYCKFEKVTEEIRSKLESTSKSFIEIGYLLKKIKESEMYKVAECNSIYEYAKMYFGLGETTTKNFINCFEKYGKVIHEYSFDVFEIEIKDEYTNYNYSQLVELLSVPEDEIEEFDFNLSVREIKELKAKKNINIEVNNYLEKLKTFAIEELNKLMNVKFSEKFEDDNLEYSVVSYKIKKTSSKYSAYYVDVVLIANVLFKCDDFKINVQINFSKNIMANTDLNDIKYSICVPSSYYGISYCTVNTYRGKLKEYLFTNKEFKKHFAIDVVNNNKDDNYDKRVNYQEYLNLVEQSSRSEDLKELQFIVDYIYNKFNIENWPNPNAFYLKNCWSMHPIIYLSKHTYLEISEYWIAYTIITEIFDDEGDMEEQEESEKLCLIDFIKEIINPGSLKDNPVCKILFRQTFDDRIKEEIE